MTVCVFLSLESLAKFLLTGSSSHLGIKCLMSAVVDDCLLLVLIKYLVEFVNGTFDIAVCRGSLF